MTNRKNLHRFASFTALCTGLLIFAGGLVTSTGSGLSVPDWPLSYGTLFPPMIGGIRFEHSHRLIAGYVGILTLILMIYLWCRESRVWLKGLGVLALALVVAQAVLGGMTVRYLLPKPISISHACLGQTFFTLLCLIAYFTSKEWERPLKILDSQAGSIQRLCLTTVFFIYLQLIAGATVRHTGGGGLKYHLFLAVMIFIHVACIGFRVVRENETRELFFKSVSWLGILVTTQVFLGFGSYIYKYNFPKAISPRTVEVLLATFHQTNGAVILALSVLITARSLRFLAKPPKLT